MVKYREDTRIVGDLVEDTDIYPRVKMDPSNVRGIVQTVDAGAENTIPPIVIDEQNRIIDGYHRRAAFKEYHGADYVVPVLVGQYADDGEAFADAVARNISRGKDLNSAELAEAVHKLSDEYGFGDDEIAVRLKITRSRVAQVKLNIVVVNTTGKKQGVKGGDRHLRARVVTPEQSTFMRTRRTGRPIAAMANEITEALELNLVPASAFPALHRLAAVIAESSQPE